MSRNKGTTSFASSFEVKIAMPLDARMVTQYYADLTDPTTWDNLGEQYTYVGMIVSVYGDVDTSNGLYVLNTTDYTLPASWTKIGTGDVTFAYVDGSLSARDVSIANILAYFTDLSTNTSYWKIYTDNSLGYRDVSIANVLSYVVDLSNNTSYWKDYVDNSLGLRDTSIAYIVNAYIPNASLSNDFVWNASNYLEVSLGAVAGLDQLIRSASLGDTLSWNGATFDVSNGLYLKESSIGSGLVFNVSTNGFSYLDVSTVGGQPFSGDVSTSHVWYDTQLDPCLATNAQLGGIPAGTLVQDLYGDNVTAILDALLFPETNPVLTNPSATFVMSPATTLYEVSTLLSLTFTTTFARGSITPQYTALSPYRSGSCNYFDYGYSGTGIGTLTDVSTTTSPNIQTLPTYRVVLGSQSWTAEVSYNAGVQPYTNKGNLYLTPLSAGHLTASTTRTIEGAYPLYATTSDINTLTKQTLVSFSTNPAPSTSGMTLVAEVGGSKQKFEIPVAWPYTTLVGVQTYNTVSTQWEYQGGSAASSLLMWTVSDSTETIQAYTINYKQYTYNGVDRNAITIRLQI